MKNTVTLIGITGYYIGTAGFAGALIGKFVIDKSEDYLIVYSIGCGFAIMGFIICLITKEDKFVYKPIGELDTNKYEDSNPEDEKLLKPSVGSNIE